MLVPDRFCMNVYSEGSREWIMIYLPINKGFHGNAGWRKISRYHQPIRILSLDVLVFLLVSFCASYCAFAFSVFKRRGRKPNSKCNVMDKLKCCNVLKGATRDALYIVHCKKCVVFTLYFNLYVNYI